MSQKTQYAPDIITLEDHLSMVRFQVLQADLFRSSIVEWTTIFVLGRTISNHPCNSNGSKELLTMRGVAFCGGSCVFGYRA